LQYPEPIKGPVFVVKILFFLDKCLPSSFFSFNIKPKENDEEEWSYGQNERFVE
jgi:hypothetical protein